MVTRVSFSRILHIVGLLLLCLFIIITIIRGKGEQDARRVKVQEGLDSACGQGVVLENSGVYSADPVFSWFSLKASCYDEISTNKWSCICK
jgi:hypothetical protein